MIYIPLHLSDPRNSPKFLHDSSSLIIFQEIANLFATVFAILAETMKLEQVLSEFQKIIQKMPLNAENMKKIGEQINKSTFELDLGKILR